jgi:predicted nucleic acid-binding protein
MRFSMDSNILIYAEGTDEPAKRDRALFTISKIGRGNIVLPMQTMGETLRWLMRKGKLDRGAAVERITMWMEQCKPLDMSAVSFGKALNLVSRRGFQIWDALILAASSEGGAAVLLSEDMQHGFTWGGVTIVNPFVLSEQELLQLTSTQWTMH